MVSKGVNKVILIGYLGQDPEVRHMSNGNAVTNITLATSDSWRDKQTGETKEKTEWHRIVLFGKMAEIAGEYLRKGAQIYIEGSLQTRKWQDQSGNDRYTTEIVVNMNGTMQMLSNRQNYVITNNTIQNSSSNQSQNIQGSNTKLGDTNTSLNNRTQNNISKISNDELIDFDDDIPF